MTDESRDAEWLRSVWEWAEDIRREYDGVDIQVSLYPTHRKGVWRAQLRALEMVDGRPAGIRIQVSGDYPNAQAQSLGAFVFQLMVKLEGELDAAKITPLLPS